MQAIVMASKNSTTSSWLSLVASINVLEVKREFFELGGVTTGDSVGRGCYSHCRCSVAVLFVVVPAVAAVVVDVHVTSIPIRGP